MIPAGPNCSHHLFDSFALFVGCAPSGRSGVFPPPTVTYPQPSRVITSALAFFNGCVRHAHGRIHVSELVPIVDIIVRGGEIGRLALPGS